MPKPEIVAQLKAVQEKLKPEGAWIKFTHRGIKTTAVRTSRHVHKAYEGQKAQCWDIQGAIAEVTGTKRFQWELCQYILRAIHLNTGKAVSMVDFNDAKETTHGTVMAVFDKAIKLAEAGEICFLHAEENSSRGWASKSRTRPY